VPSDAERRGQRELGARQRDGSTNLWRDLRCSLERGQLRSRGRELRTYTRMTALEVGVAVDMLWRRKGGTVRRALGTFVNFRSVPTASTTIHRCGVSVLPHTYILVAECRTYACVLEWAQSIQIWRRSSLPPLLPRNAGGVSFLPSPPHPTPRSTRSIRRHGRYTTPRRSSDDRRSSRARAGNSFVLPRLARRVRRDAFRTSTVLSTPA
jgi:hypothetical protein